jgi:hypothetical protein
MEPPMARLTLARKIAAIRTGSMGTVKKKNVSDLVLLAARPLIDVNNTRKIEAVILKGRLIDRKSLDELLAGVETASRH